MILFNKEKIVFTCIQTVGKPCVYVANWLRRDVLEIWGSVCEKYQSVKNFDLLEILASNCGCIFFDNIEEATEFFEFFNQPPIRSSGLYVCIYDESGNIIEENT